MSTLFEPLTVRGMTVSNRIAMSPMLMYMAAEDGVARDLHLVHYGARILGGVGLVMTEVTAVLPEGRISTSDLGLWSDEHIPGLARIVDFAHEHGAKMGLQVAHAGRKSKAQEQGVAPSAIAYEGLPVPRELTAPEIDDVVGAYAEAARRAVAAGFDCLELHVAHGYLLHEFLSPIANARTDEYGGSLENRSRIVLRIASEIRRIVPDSMPIFVRLSAEDVVDGGLSLKESSWLASQLMAEGVDLFDVSTGNIVPGYEAPVYPGYQANYALDLKKELGVMTAAMGSISSPELAEYLVSSGAADLVFVGRALLRDPHWALGAARLAGADPHLAIPTYARATGPYERGF
ncbi:NADH:flavin oxidoreductase/NADH oxidase [Arthrobacter sp. NPDC056493]|uniref:NADH:flavin oxidoreductase/NADH oxidase n=1 Tax=Arthrobacter sp. NPDC056493 TaxID=3345839 RepID=UPI00366E0E6D